MLALSSALATAQEATIQNPTIEVTFSKLTAALPLQGQRLDSETRTEVQPGLITLSNGALCAAYFVTETSTVSDILRIAYTDAEQLSYTFVDVLTSGNANHNITQTALVETTEVSGSATTHNLLIFYVEGAYSYKISWVKCSLTGTFISKGTFYSGASTTAPLSVALLFDGTNYFAAYARKSTDTTGGTKVYYRKSTNTTTWGSEVNVPLSGLAYANNILNVNLVMAGSEILLWFDHTETDTNIYNVYYVRSLDDGANWSSPNLVTAYSFPDVIGRHPYAFTNTTTGITVAFDEIRTALHMSSATTNWSGGDMTPASMHFNASTRQLYVVAANTGVGYKICKGVMGVDVDSWVITAYWDNTTVPAMNSYWFTNDGTGPVMPNGGTIRGEGNYIILLANEGHICLIDAGSNQIFDYNFQPNTTHGMAANVSGTSDLYNMTGTTFLARAMVDATNNKIYCLFINIYFYNTGVFVGSVEIDHGKTLFTWSSVISEKGIWDSFEVTPFTVNNGDLFVDLASDMFAVSAGCTQSFVGRLRVYSLSGAVLLQDYTYASNSQFPYFGLTKITFLSGVIYGVFTWTNNHGQSALRGLCAVDPTANSVTFYVPGFLSVDDMLGNAIFATTDSKIIIACHDLGIATWSLAGGWNLYNNSVLPGLSPGMTEYYKGPLSFDAANQLIFCSFDDSLIAKSGIAAFSVAGNLSSPQYMIGTETSGTWAFTTPAQLVDGIFNQKTAISKSLGGYIAAFWLNLYNFIYWDIESGGLDATPYLMRGSDVTIAMQMDGSPAKLSLTLANGYLFEQFNQASLLAPFAQKGKVVLVRFGEMISGAANWQPGYFRFVITTQKMSYRRGDRPTITIEAEDRRVLYDQQGTITATPYFDTTLPDAAITTLLTTYGNWLSSEVDIQPLDGGTALEQQWLDKNLIDVINEIAHRYQYFLYINTTNGKIMARKIDFSAAADHVYPTLIALDQFTPDDNFSDFTNKITVIGESPTQIPVNYPEERITGMSGTLGWWKKQGEQTVWYSDDKTKTCVNPRLDVIQTANNIAYLLAGQVTEKITSEDVNHQYVIVEIDAPDLTYVLVAAIAMIIAARLMPPVVTPTGPAKSWIASLTGELGMWLAMQVLASVGPYQYDIYGQPTGYIRQSLEASAYDYTFQALLNGTTIEKRIDEPLCHSVSECQDMANFELSLVQAQRSRMKMIKTAHLQDEPGDIIQIIHPYSLMTMQFYVATINRKMHIPDISDTAGIFTDEIEGWKI